MATHKKRTNTVIGTPHYMAPEILNGLGYTNYVDLWSLGICMYEFLCGFVPFGEEEDDPYNVYKLIINEIVEFPDILKGSENEDAINFM